MKDKKISVVIIGLGEAGFFNDFKNKNTFKSHFRSLSKNKFFKIKALIDRDAVKLSKIKAPGLKKYSKINEEISDISPDLVIISANTHNHYNIFLELINFYIPKVILFEKPFGKNIKESKCMNLIAKKYSIKIFVNFIRESNPGYVKLRKFLLKNNKDFTNIIIQYNNSFQNNTSHWFIFFHNIYGKLNKIYDLNLGKKNFTKNILLNFDNANINFIQSSEVKKNNFFLNINSKNYCISINSNEEITIFYKTNKKINQLKIETNMYRYQYYVYENLVNYFYNNKYNLITSIAIMDRLKTMYKVIRKYND